MANLTGNAADVAALQKSSGVNQGGQNVWSTPTANAANAVATPSMGGSGIPAPMAPTTSASTTTISNSNKQNQVAGIQNNTAALAQTGVTTDPNGNAVYANGTTVPAPPEPQTGTPKPNPSISTSGGYIGDVYYAPGATLPVDEQGNPQPTTDSSPTDTKILNDLNSQKAQADALTASAIDNIQAQYQQLIQSQQQANNSANSNIQNALLMGGSTGSGSSAQFAPISSAGIMQSQVSYGISQISNLQTKENTAILAAKQAGQNQDFALQDKINSYISGIRDMKVAAANKLSNQLATANANLATQKLEATQSTAVNNLYMSGVTDPSQILKTLNDQGMNLTASDVKTVLGSINTDSVANLKDIQTAGITAPFANKNGEIINAKTGQAIDTPEDFFKASGVSSFEEAYQKGLVQDLQPKLTFQVEKVGGQSVRFGFDAQGKVVSKTVLGGGGSGSSKTSAKDDIQSMSSQLDTVKGDDGYISPEDYKSALSAWTKAGYSATSFKTNFGNLINPADTKDYK